MNRGSRFAAIRIATGSQRFQIARFELQGQNPFESLFGGFAIFAFKIVFTSRESMRLRIRIVRSMIRIVRFETSKPEDVNSENSWFPPPGEKLRKSFVQNIFV